MSDQRPNFLVIMPDQMRGDCLSCEGHPAILTPNMDYIAEQGTRFAHAYTTCPSCIPARRSFMSGQFPATNGMVGYAEGYEWEPEATMPGELKKAGYETILLGRNMHHHPPDKKYGFGQWVLQESRDSELCEYTRDLQRAERDSESAYLGTSGMAHGISGNGFTARPWHLDESLHPTTWTTTQTVRYLQKRDPSTPFFAVASYIAPHPPLVPPAFYMDRYLRMELPEPSIGDWAVPPRNGGIGARIDADHVHLRGEMWRSCAAGYYGLINHLDDQIYRILQAVPWEAKQNLVVIVTSDHGEMLGDHFLFRKTYPFEGSARIPMLISAGANLGFVSGNVDHRPVCLEDIMPTVLELAGLDVPDSVDGKSMVSMLRGEDTSWRDYLHGEHSTCYRKEQANHYLTDGHEKYVWMTEEGTELLFDLDSDPNECRNLAVKPHCEAKLEAWRDRMIERLKGRPEGFTDGYRLIPGRPYTAALPHASAGVER